MSFNKKVVKLLKEKKKTKAQLAKAAEIPYTTLDSMLKRDSDTNRLGTIYKIAKYLDVSVEELVFDDPKAYYSKKAQLSEAESRLIDNFRNSDERGKTTILSLSDFESSKYRFNLQSIVSKELKLNTKKIPVYVSPAAAGEPLPILADDYSLVDAESAPADASFGVRISGDSMEPVIPDLSVVWVKKQDVLENGDVGIFVLNGESICKKLSIDNGKCSLMSFNTKYFPIEVLDTDDLRVVGKVIM